MCRPLGCKMFVSSLQVNMEGGRGVSNMQKVKSVV